MISHVYNSRFIRFCFILNINSIIVRQFHYNSTIQISRKTLFTIFRQVSQFHLSVTHLNTSINTILKSLRTSMQTMSVIVSRQLVYYLIQ